MRLAFLVVLLLAPGAAAWSVRIDAPVEVEARASFAATVCAEAPGRAQLRILAANATLDVREDRYLDAFEGAVCREVRVRAGEAPVALEARVRAAEGGAPRARAWHNVTMVTTPPVLATPMRVAGDVIAYATPASGPREVVAAIDAARAEVLAELYTLTNEDVAAALGRALERGARVRVLLEGAPVGGIPPEERALVAGLAARGAEVGALGGAGARYRTVHAKLVVVDRAVLAVGTENFHDPASRGYGLVVHNATLAARAAAVILRDIAGSDVSPFDARADAAPALPLVREYEGGSVFSGARNVSLVLSPDDPLAVARLVANATRTVEVEMLRMDAEGPLADALVAAAQNGARVRVLLDGRFDDGANRAAIARLRPLGVDARLDAGARVLHAKMAVVDGRASYVGSMNWVRAAVEENREAGLLVEDEGLARWLQKEFEKDWAGPPEVKAVSAPPLWMIAVAAVLSRRLPRARARRRSRV